MADVQNAPVQLADVKWSTDVVVSMTVTGAPGILAPCGHPLQPKALVLLFLRSSLPDHTLDWELKLWEMAVVHPASSVFDTEHDLTLTSDHFGEGVLPATPLQNDITDVLSGVLGMEVPKGDVERLGPVPEWVETAIRTYQPYADFTTPVRTSDTYHG